MVSLKEARERINAEVGKGMVSVFLLHEGFDITNVVVMQTRRNANSDDVTIMGGIVDVYAKEGVSRWQPAATDKIRNAVQSAIDVQFAQLVPEMLNDDVLTLDEIIEALRAILKGGELWR